MLKKLYWLQLASFLSWVCGVISQSFREHIHCLLGQRHLQAWYVPHILTILLSCTLRVSCTDPGNKTTQVMSILCITDNSYIHSVLAGTGHTFVDTGRGLYVAISPVDSANNPSLVRNNSSLAAGLLLMETVMYKLAQRVITFNTPRIAWLICKRLLCPKRQSAIWNDNQSHKNTVHLAFAAWDSNPNPLLLQ